MRPAKVEKAWEMMNEMGNTPQCGGRPVGLKYYAALGRQVLVVRIKQLGAMLWLLRQRRRRWTIGMSKALTAHCMCMAR
ncbi:Uncharacterised protein [Serratia fonticola]|uniref:Uncharacterized protein n=1 Tax=Serratia fonticola TaxID=47917 RepID=A0A4U9WJX7_SERFO|nr:Uncharacterised protein [Serratia fonticola]